MTYNISDPGGVLKLRAERLFQAVAYPFAKDLRPNDTDAVTRFMAQYDASDKTPKTVATAQTTVG